MPESLCAFAPVVAGQIKLQALSLLYLSNGCAVTGPYNSQRNLKLSV